MHQPPSILSVNVRLTTDINFDSCYIDKTMVYPSSMILYPEVQVKSESYDLILKENAYLKQRLETVIRGKCCKPCHFV